MKTTLVYPQMWVRKDEFFGITPPLGLCYLAAVLEKEHQVTIINAQEYSDTIIEGDYKRIGLSTYHIVQKIIETKPDIVGISCPLSIMWNDVAGISRLLRSEYDCVQVIGGFQPSAFPEQCLSDSCADYVIVGEGETAFKDIVDGKAKEKIVRRPLITDLDTIPFPARHLINMEKYIKMGMAQGSQKRERYTTMISCYDEETELLTKRGWIPFRYLTYRDEVATLSKNNTLEYEFPENIMSQYYEGDMYEIKSKNIDLLITPNHYIYARKQKKDYFSLYQIQDVYSTGDMEFCRRVSWKGKESQYFTLPEVKYDSSNKGVKEKIIKMDDWLEFLGYYISEGNSQFKENNNYGKRSTAYIVKISQSKEKNYHTWSLIKNSIEKLGYNYCLIKDGFYISDKQLYSYLQKFGKCHEKYIPEYVFSLSQRQLNILLMSLIEGDGCTYKKDCHYHYTTVSKSLADHVQEIAIKVGYDATIYKKKMDRITPAFIKGRKITSIQQIYDVVISKGMGTPLINHQGKRHVKKADYKGMIYCCTVPNSILYVRRNGKPCWSGNSRGCPNNCTFCSAKVVWTRKWRARSAENVVAEIEHLKEKYNINEIHFEDDNISLDKKRMNKICDLIIEKGLDISWTMPNGIASGTLDKDTILKMKLSGCYQLNFGIETGNEYILKNVIKKNMDLNHTKEVIQWTKDAGIWSHGFFICGFNSETKKMIYDSLKYAKESGLDSAFWNIATPYPATELYDMMKVKMDFKDFNKLRGCDNVLGSDVLSAEELKKIQKDINREFFKYGIMKQMNPINIISKIKSIDDLNYYMRKLKRIIKVW